MRWLLTGGAVPILLIVCGLFFSIYLKLQPLCSPKRMWKALTARREGGVSPFRAVMLALAGTLGVGNIVGVANALFIGGAGAVFWMWISALVAMVLKYAEILLAVRYRRTGREGSFFGGAYYYIKDYFEGRKLFRTAAVLSAAFAVLMIVDALGMGCMIQVNAVSTAFDGVWKLPPWLCGIGLVLLTLPVIVRGSKGISALTELLVPIMTAGYVILSVAVLIIKRDAVGEAFSSILHEAFRIEGVGGGVIGFLTSRALRMGTMRGLFSNEAGCGTAPTAHAAANALSPAAQGVWGMVEVFVDTILLCTATALVILVSFSEVEMLGHDAVMMTVRAYSTVLGGWAEWFFCAAILCFGYATLLCWANYGLESLRFLSSKRVWRYLYFLIFAVCIFLGATATPDSIWDISDFAIAALTTVNLVVLFLMRREIREETERFVTLPKK